MPRLPRRSNRTAPCACRLALAAALCLGASLAHAAPPAVASINLCADQLVLALADPEQVLTVSWLSADPEESLFATAAARHTLNYGTAEELLRFHPDVVNPMRYCTPPMYGPMGYGGGGGYPQFHPAMMQQQMMYAGGYGMPGYYRC